MSNTKLPRFPWFTLVVVLLLLSLLVAVGRSPEVWPLVQAALTRPDLTKTPTPAYGEATPTAVSVLLQIKTGDLKSDPRQVQKDEFVTLVVVMGDEGAPTGEILRYPDLHVKEVLDSSNRDIIMSGGDPDKILLSVDRADYDAILLTLQDKKAMYLESQGKATTTPTSTPAATPTTDPAAITATRFSILLPIKVSELGNDSSQIEHEVRRGELVTLRFLTAGKDDATPEPTSYYDLKVEAVLDANGHDVTVTRRKPHTILLSISEESCDNILLALEDTNKKAAYLLPQGTATITPLEEPMPTTVYEEGERVQFELKVSDVASGATLFEPGAYRAQENDYVRLVIVSEKSGAEGKNESETASYDDVQIVDLLDAGGRSVLITGATPSSILLCVPKDKFDAIIKKLQGKQAVYLLPQGIATVEPTPTPEYTSTPVPIRVDFLLPANEIRSDLSFKPGDNVVVIVVVERKDAEGKVVEQKPYYYDGVKLRDVLNAHGTPIAHPYKEADIVRISLPRGTDDATAKEFAGHLTGASAIYLLSALPTPTPTPTPSPTPTQGG